MLFGGPTSKTIMRIICTKNVSKQPSTGGMEYDAAVASYLRALPQVEIKCLDEYNGRKWFAPMHSSNLLAQIRGTGWEKFVLLAYFPQRYELLPILSNKTVEGSRKLLMVHNTHLLSDKPALSIPLLIPSYLFRTIFTGSPAGKLAAARFACCIWGASFPGKVLDICCKPWPGLTPPLGICAWSEVSMMPLTGHIWSDLPKSWD